MQPIDFSLFGSKRIRHIQQTEIAECGLACLTMISGFYGNDVELSTMRRQFPPSSRGTSLRSLMTLAEQMGFTSRPLKLPLEGIRELQTPAILHWDMNHFVVLEKVSKGGAMILNPAAGSARRMTMAEISEHFTGVALELTQTATFVPTEAPQKIRLNHLWSRLRGWKRAAVQTLILTLVLQVFALTLPFYIQLAIDNVVPTGDHSLLAVLAIGFGAFTIFNGAAALLRSFVLLNAGTTLGFTLASNVARRLFRLPVTWFERRSVGDVLSRFQSVQPIEDALTKGIVAALVDGLLAILTLVIMCWYSVGLATIAVLAFVLYTLVRAISFRAERNANEAVIVANGREQSTLIETVRGITPLRLFGRESERHVLWQNRMADEVNANVSAARIRIWQETSNTVVFGLENIISIWLAISLVLSGGFSIGMLVAFLAYKQQFIARAAALIDQGIAFQMLGLHLERLGDIALEPEDHGLDDVITSGSEFSGNVELKGLMFRYSDADPMVLRGVTLNIPAGSHLAITGPSGGGKSTLAKIILGLAEPASGELLVDGVPLRTFGYKNYRRQIAAVLQEDSLFAGTIAENIALFDEAADPEAIAEAGRQAAIHRDIEAMPMKYETLVGDMGSTVSGGQKARILLARALYRKPRLILLDEGTAHLDAETESVVSAAIRDLGITRIVIAHRRETIAAADQRVFLANGMILGDA
ncbi:peptidase domain-containing ABC transporter [Sphingomonas sp. 3-13AW]|uniref:peptidase domain-containing ABC transporter n=1 Tax=Sphingomonas sp. 3-13AW TaxID=3050450 RepID=UPI003BB54150